MTKSIAEMHAKLCDRIRNDSNDGIISRLRRICEDEYARKATLDMLNLKPGEVHYDISSDSTWKMEA